jgi:hypothetical protein
MHPLQTPNRPWSCIGIDFVVKLPLLDGFDSILVIVNHFAKAIHPVPASESWTAEEFAYSFFDCFIRYHGLPDKIVSDRGSLFVSKFWREVQRLLRIKVAPSTAWHPRTDGQTEQANQTFKTCLCHFVCDRQDNWARLLPIAELIFNTSVSSSTGSSPFFSQFAFHPQTNMFSGGSLVPAAKKWIETLINVQETLIENIQAAKEFQKKHFDCHTCEVPVYEKGDWVGCSGKILPLLAPPQNWILNNWGLFVLICPWGMMSIVSFSQPICLAFTLFSMFLYCFPSLTQNLSQAESVQRLLGVQPCWKSDFGTNTMSKPSWVIGHQQKMFTNTW